MFCRFFFNENDFFTNKILTKSYTVHPDLLDDKAPALSEIVGTEIDWKPKKNLCVKETQKKQKAKSGKKAGQTRVVTKTEPQPSFFNFFSDPIAPEDDDDEEGDEDDDEENPAAGGRKEADACKFTIDEDYEAAHSFRTEIIPEAIYWYTGEACGDDDEDFDEEEEDDEDEGSDDDDEDDEPDEESEDVAPGGGGGKKKSNKSAKRGGAGAAPAGQQPECKQS